MRVQGLALLLLSGVLAATPAAAADPGPMLSVDASAGRHAISPYIYGWNSAPFPLADEIDLPVDRRGGNRADTLNWQTGVENTGSDYFFENLPWCWSDAFNWCSPQPPGTEAHRAYTDQIDADQGIGAKTLIDVPMLGYVPKGVKYSHPFDCSFPKTTFMTQDAFDPFDTNCGSGQNGGDGHWVTNTAQLDDAQAASPAYQGDWVDDLVSRYDTAANRGVGFYELGNEPGLWDYTHHDWHPDPVDDAELWSKSRALASEIKSRDPSANVLAFSEWGWPNYFCSAADIAGGTCDGGTDLAGWLLQQFKQWADDHGGERLIDYFDLHYYRQGGTGIEPTRSLWDPSYTDPSWIDDTIRLLPRMHDWVDDNYPGTKISLSEYDLSNGDADEDNLIQADVLGIFARERLDLATLWPLEDTSHYADAFRLFRDYDGAGSKFGETYVQSGSVDQSRLAVYGAQRSGDGALTLVVVNKSMNDLTSGVSLAGFTPAGTAHVWRWSSVGGGIQPDADEGVSASGFTSTFPARSMTMLVIPPATPAAGDQPPAPPGGSTDLGSPPGPGSEPVPAPTTTRPPVPCRVPKLTGVTLKQAKAKLRKAHCRLGRVTKKKSRARQGRVIAQKPKRGSVRRSGTKVSVVLSRGR